MSIVGIQDTSVNPTYTVEDFLFWMPQFDSYFKTPDGQRRFNKLYTLANEKVSVGIFGSDWEVAMSLCIAHYLTLIAQQVQAPAGSELGDIAGGGVTRGVLSSASIGEFSKQYDINKTMSEDEEALWWNQTSFGTSFYALMKTKHVASIFVVTSNPVPGA